MKNEYEVTLKNYTRWDEELGSYILTEEGKKLSECDMINVIGNLEHRELSKIKEDISKNKTEHEMRIAEKDIKAKLLISDIYCDVVNILDEYMV